MSDASTIIEKVDRAIHEFCLDREFNFYRVLHPDSILLHPETAREYLLHGAMHLGVGAEYTIKGMKIYRSLDMPKGQVQLFNRKEYD